MRLSSTSVFIAHNDAKKKLVKKVVGTLLAKHDLLPILTCRARTSATQEPCTIVRHFFDGRNLQPQLQLGYIEVPT